MKFKKPNDVQMAFLFILLLITVGVLIALNLFKWLDGL